MSVYTRPILAAFALCSASAQAQITDPVAGPTAESQQLPQAESTYDTIPVEPPAPQLDPLPTQKPRSSIGMEEIIVTAQRRSESVNDVPIAISAFSGDDLQALGVKDTRDLAKLVPGFTAADGGGNTPIYTLRGVGFNDTTYTATSTVGVYVDEVSLPYSVMTRGTGLDLERVEVLKGPQGILYGRNTTGGAINYIARRPSEVFEAGISGSYARFDTTEIEAYVSGHVLGEVNGRLAVKDTRSQKGWQYSNTRPGDTLGEKNKQAFRGALDWSVSDQLSLRAVVEGWWDRSDAQARQAIGLRQQNGAIPTERLFAAVLQATGLDLRSSYLNGLLLPPQANAYPLVPQNANPRVADWPESYPWKLDDQFLAASLRADWQLGERVSFTGIASQMRVDSDQSELPSAGFNYNAFEQILTAHIETSSIEGRFSGQLGADDEIEWMFGGNASKDRGYEQHDQLADYQSALFPNPLTGRSILTNSPGTFGRSTVEQLAGFANVGWKFAEALKVTAGARYTRQSQDYQGCAYVSELADYDLLSPTFTALSAANALTWTADINNLGQPGAPSVVQTGDCFTLADNGSNAIFSQTLDEDNVSLRLALDWQPDVDSLYYVSAGRGFKAGGYPVLSASSQNQLKPVVQEEVLAYELGSKLTLLQRQLHANFATYFYDYKNKQLLTKTPDPVFGPLPILQNAPKAEVYGVELDLQYAPTAISGLFLAASGAYTHTEIKQFQGLDQRGLDTDFAGRPFNFAPQWQGTLLANYNRPISGQLNAVLGADYRYSGSTSSVLEDDPAFRHRAYGVLGARIGVEASNWSLIAFGRNLGNELIPITVLAYGDSISRFVGEPRSYGLTLAYRW